MSEPQPPGAAPEGGIAAVVVLAAGQGTRMRSATPKVLHALGGRSMLGHVLAATAPLAARHTLVVVGAGREAVEEHLAQVAPGARPVLQEEQRGSGHAAAVALAAVPDLEGAVLLVNGDPPLLRPETVTALLDAHRAAGAGLPVLTPQVVDPTGPGLHVVAADGAVRAIGLTEGLLIGLLSWLGAALLAVPVGRLFVEIVAMLTRTPLPYAFAPRGVLFWLVIVLVLAALASIVPARRAVRLSVRAALAYE